MKVLFAVSNESISEAIVRKYQQMYKEIIISKNVYYYNAIIKELEKDKTYDRIVISEDLEPFTNNNYETIDNFIFEKLDSISDEASNSSGEDIPIILVALDRRTKTDNILVKLFGIGVYSTLIGQDRSIDEVCKLIRKPRTKKEAKVYYKIDASEVSYEPENDANVSEAEIQSILTHYKRLGRNEERYVESFDSIASQYTDKQLKLIIKFLPINVKAVLEANSPRYQQLTSYEKPATQKYGQYQSKNKTKLKNNVSKTVSNDGIKVESIPSGEKKLTKPVIIPSASTIRKVQKVEEPEKTVEIKEEIKPEEIQKKQTQEVKKRRGRPKKVQVEETNIEENEEKTNIVQEAEEKTEEVKKRRGRPRKNPEPEEVNAENEEMLLPGLEETVDSEESEDEDTILPGFEDELLPGFDDENPIFDDDVMGKEEQEEEKYIEEQPEDEILPGWDVEEDEEYNEDEIESKEEPRREEISNYNTTSYAQNMYNQRTNESHLENYAQTNINIQNLLTKDKKIVAFVGTTKNGTSFLINNLAEMLSKQGIKTAILDLTENRNSYYIYTKNEEELRKIAYNCPESLSRGIAEGIKVNNNLDVYTSLPGESEELNNYGEVLETLVKNYSLILLDCDFTTQYGYLKEASEIYLVQTMDVLTIQPLTAYLRELKAKGILEPEKLRAVINKYTRVKGVSEKAIIGGMSMYNDPAMSFMTELFNRETIQYCLIPFDIQGYAKYLACLINCEVSLNGYSKEFMNALNKLANMVYPVIGSSKNSNRAKYNNPKYNKYASENVFSNDMNSTLDKMKRNY